MAARTLGGWVARYHMAGSDEFVCFSLRWGAKLLKDNVGIFVDRSHTFRDVILDQLPDGRDLGKLIPGATTRPATPHLATPRRASPRTPRERAAHEPQAFKHWRA